MWLYISHGAYKGSVVDPPSHNTSDRYAFAAINIDPTISHPVISTNPPDVPPYTRAIGNFIDFVWRSATSTQEKGAEYYESKEVSIAAPKSFSINPPRVFYKFNMSH